VSSKLNQARIDGEPYNSTGLSFTPNVVHGHDELTKRPYLLLLIGFNKTRLGQPTVRALWGVSPISGFYEAKCILPVEVQAAG
jgi:hypothetical protein